ncbi:MAG: hypothetical protein NTU81_02610 [Candidatus Nomurabacteria bacterium]|nr:hypothetical protein [Candidatus Nomurabacteria bacterium]
MRDIPTSPRIIEIKHNLRVRRLKFSILFFALFIFLIGGFSYFSQDKHVTLEKLEITGTHIINQSDIEDEVLKDISGKYLHLFSRSNSFIYPHRQIYNNLLLNFPRIEKLSVYRDNLKTLHISLVERTGSSLYCGNDIPTNKEDIGENCYFINNDGFIFDKAPYFSGNVYFKYYMTLENNPVNPLAKQMMNIDSFHKLSRFIDGISSIGFKPVYMTVGSNGTNSLYLNHGENYTTPRIIFNKDNDLDIIKDNLALSMGKKEFADEINSKYNTLLYIDLTFKNKVLYKFQ